MAGFFVCARGREGWGKVKAEKTKKICFILFLLLRNHSHRRESIEGSAFSSRIMNHKATVSANASAPTSTRFT
jgi:hypothetical protein